MTPIYAPSKLSLGILLHYSDNKNTRISTENSAPTAVNFIITPNFGRNHLYHLQFLTNQFLSHLRLVEVRHILSSSALAGALTFHKFLYLELFLTKC